jgi:hypothetical protein
MSDKGISEQQVQPVIESINNDVCSAPLQYESSSLASPTLKRGRETEDRKGTVTENVTDAQMTILPWIPELPAASSSSSVPFLPEQQDEMNDDESCDDEAEGQDGERKSTKTTLSGTASSTENKVAVVELKSFSCGLFLIQLT